MSQLFDRAIASVRNLPPEAQDEIARLLLQLTAETEGPAIPMTDAEEASFEASFRQAERGEFASEEAVRAVWAKHGL